MDHQPVRLRAVRKLRAGLPEEMPDHGKRLHGTGHHEEERHSRETAGREERGGPRRRGGSRRQAGDGCGEVRILYALCEEMPAGSDPGRPEGKDLGAGRRKMRGVRDLRGSVPEESDRDERVNTLFENAARIGAAFLCLKL